MVQKEGLLTYLPGHESLAGTGWPDKKDSLDVLAAQLLHDLWREHAGSKGAPIKGAQCLSSLNKGFFYQVYQEDGTV